VPSTNELRTWLSGVLTPDGPGGGQVVVTRAGETLVDEAFGRCPTTGRAIDPDTRFPWFSATKPISAAPVHLLVGDGALSYDDPVARHLPAFAAEGKGAVTIRQLLNHTAGIADTAGRVSPELYADPVALARALCSLPLEHRPGERVIYHAHTATAVLALVAEAVSGRPFADLVQERVLSPLGMTGTCWHPDARATRIRATNPDLHATAASFDAVARQAVFPGGGLHGTARDLARFYDGLVAGLLLDARTLAEATRLVAPFSSVRTIGFGLHFIVGSDPAMPTSRGATVSTATFGHPGWVCTLALHDPTRALTVVALANTALPQDESDARFAQVCDRVVADVDA
jgi:CubicO group peptidase (beta-lactamase class C family)